MPGTTRKHGDTSIFGIPLDQRSRNGPQLAQQLEQILDRDVRFDVASLSGSVEGDRADGLAANRERVDSFRLNSQEVELDLEHVVLQSGLSVWLFSSDSIALIPQLAKLVSDSLIESHLPQPLVDWKLIDTPLWRWIALVLLAAVLGPLSRLVPRPHSCWLMGCASVLPQRWTVARCMRFWGR